jgi:hypothetical protein
MRSTHALLLHTLTTAHLDCCTAVEWLLKALEAAACLFYAVSVLGVCCVAGFEQTRTARAAHTLTAALLQNGYWKRWQLLHICCVLPLCLLLCCVAGFIQNAQHPCLAAAHLEPCTGVEWLLEALAAASWWQR